MKFRDIVNEGCGKKKKMREEQVECPKCKGKGCDHCNNTGYHDEVSEGEADVICSAKHDGNEIKVHVHEGKYILKVNGE